MDWFTMIFITPLELLYLGLFEAIQIFVKNLGCALLVLSFVTVALMIPLERCVSPLVKREKHIERILEPQIKEIKENFSGAEQHAALKRLYARYRYNPVLSVCSALGVLIQLPFLLGAYWMLTEYSAIKGISFGPISDLSLPDGLLFGINLLPLLMTAINLATIVVSRLEKRDAIQALFIAVLFLVLLYTAPSALLLYWTMNNVLHFVRAGIRQCAENKFVRQKLQKTKALLVAADQSFSNFLGRQLSRFAARALSFVPKCVQSIWMRLWNCSFTKIARNRFETEFKKNDWQVLLILSAVTPACFLWFSNIGFFSPEEIATSLWMVFFIMIFVMGVFYLLKHFCHASFFKQIFIAFVVFFSAVAFYKCSSLMHAGLAIPALIKKSTPFVVFFFVVIVGRIKLANVLLVTLLFAALATGFYETTSANQATIEAAKANKVYSIKLKERPNFYYVICESMQSLDIARDIYEVEDTEKFRDFLKSNGFYVPDYVYSNSDHTLATMTNIFSMKEQAWGVRGTLDLGLAGRSLIAGGVGNNLLLLLKENGYRTAQYLKGSSYFYRQKGPLLDVTDVNDFSPLEPMGYLHFWPISKINTTLQRNFHTVKILNGRKVERNYLRIIDNDIKERKGVPSFLLIHMNYTHHSPTIEVHDYTKAEQWKKTGLYKRQYKKEMDALCALTNRILEKDPDAVIVYCGDHGAWRFRSYPNSIEELETVLKEAKIRYQDYLDDRVKVFAAVRLPKKYGQLDGKFSPANVFAKIFNQIGYEGKPLTIAPNETYLTGLDFIGGAAIKEGTINDAFMRK